ncbi:integrase family protein [Marine Group I thaumarchaeote SCGC AAA799-P11]|uniref:Integrase family protein n=1 Tax=Marine Group I thaumarchaeote SCGC AAA799-P11 TaxID=1502295 RepID=A0A087S114_9ARCH|nr:integrase family protein [Marine Group I thaumarchaeote SCGC AAA799-P11]
MAQRIISQIELSIQKELDEQKVKSKAYFKFKQAIKKPTTLRAYKLALDRFMILSNMKSYDKVTELKSDKIQDLLESYIISLNKMSFQTANQRLAGVELFFDMNMVLYHKKILRKLLPGNDKEQGGKLAYTTEEIKEMLSLTTKLRSKAIIHFFASTGCRPSAIADPIFRLKHVEEMNHKCKSILVYSGSKEKYYAFLTPEASKALDSYLNQRKLNGEKLDEESPVFANISDFPTTKQAHLSVNSTNQIIRDILKKSSIERKRNGQRHDKAELYGFRKRFNTILKLENEINSNIAEKLMAHKRGLDGTYLQPTKEECFGEFIKAIPQLTIDSTQKQQIQIKDLEEKLETTENLKARIQSLEESKGLYKQEMELMSKKKHTTIEDLQEQMQEMAKAIQELKKE